jgi:transketolase
MSEFIYASSSECRRMLDFTNDRYQAVATFADACRLNTLSMIAEAGSGHIGSSFSSLDIVAWLHVMAMGRRAESARDDGDIYFSSKGHDAPGLYAVLIALGVLDETMWHRLRRLGGLPGHPDVAQQGCMITNTGSLGMGISKAKGFVRADRHFGRSRRIFVLLGDGELQEGQIWESLGSAARAGMREITAIVDHNKMQSDTWVADTADLGHIEAKFASFGWHVQRCDGHDLPALDAALKAAEDDARPSIIIADTVKGRGIGFMETMSEIDGQPAYLFHSGAPSREDYARGVSELRARIDARLTAAGQKPLAVTGVAMAPAPKAHATESLVQAYSAALVKNMGRNPAIVALDSDLAKDCGLWTARKLMPGRVIECGIAEQDMVSQAGAMALGGLLPVVHSFACFLTPRANEQIFNNATEGRKVVYAGSLAGLVPGMPGHSHQMIRDIALMSSLPNVVVVEPSCEAELAGIVDHILGEQPESAYLRLVSFRYSRKFPEPKDKRVRVGHGAMLREGRHAAIVTYGPVLLNEAWQAAEQLAAKGEYIAVINMPWLNRFVPQWLQSLNAWPTVMIVDNHATTGGLGDLLSAALSTQRPAFLGRLIKVGIDGVAACGGNNEVLNYHGLSADRLAERLTRHIREAA